MLTDIEIWLMNFDDDVLFAYSEKETERVTFTQHNYLRFSELQRFLEEGELLWKKNP